MSEATYHDALVGHSRAVPHGHLTHDAVDYAFAQLGPLDGRIVLDLGCGRGRASLRLARLGADVVACDISPRMVAATLALATGCGLSAQVQPLVMSAHMLALPAASVDAVLGISVLHHLDYRAACREVSRVLRPGGRAVFVEPLGHNPLLRLFRLLTPAARTDGERPLRWPQLAGWQHREFYLLGLLAAPRALRLLRPSLARLDAALLRAHPALRRWCWITVMWH